MPLAFLDTPSGISGDMFLGCLLDSGWPVDALRSVVSGLRLPRDSWEISAEEVTRGGVRATLVRVDVKEDETHRHLADVERIIGRSELPASVKQRACSVFRRLAEAEANIHGSTPEQVHFHEVGALDAIIDIVGVCAGLHELNVERLGASALPLGPGWAKSQHGPIPLPAPATLALLAAVDAPTVPAPGEGELVTPTGAALLAELGAFDQPAMRLQRVGYGAGRKQFDWPNVARLWLGYEADEEAGGLDCTPSGALVIIETNIDDMSPELYEPVRRLLLEAGALDVWTTAIGMKKGRPATKISVLAEPGDEPTLAAALLRQTTTLGVRVYPVRRHIAERTFANVDTPYGAVGVKLKRVGGEVVGAKAEFEDCRRLAAAAGAPLPAVYAAAQAAASALVSREAALPAQSGSGEGT
ncbi:MAG: nickel pincer cofactor biosynthesis protein LarC [Caldilineaceae bacterium]|nr:nickel pincer cofactor biosynthesis protein LarC [Caldilineaceae bacterium]